MHRKCYFFVKNDLRTYDNMWRIVIGQGDYCTSGCLLDYNNLKSYYKMIAIDLNKEHTLDADPKAIQQINWTPVGSNLLSSVCQGIFLEFRHATFPALAGISCRWSLYNSQILPGLNIL